MKAKDLDIIAQGLAPVVRQFVAQKVAPILLRVHALETQCAQLRTRVRALESTKAVTPPSNRKTLPVVNLEAPLPVVRLGTAYRRRVVRL